MLLHLKQMPHVASPLPVLKHILLSCWCTYCGRQDNSSQMNIYLVRRVFVHQILDFLWHFLSTKIYHIHEGSGFLDRRLPKNLGTFYDVEGGGLEVSIRWPLKPFDGAPIVKLQLEFLAELPWALLGQLLPLGQGGICQKFNQWGNCLEESGAFHKSCCEGSWIKDIS